MKEWLQSSWKTMITIVTALGMLTAATVFYSTLATSADLEKAKTEIRTEFQKSMQLDRDIARLNSVNDNLMKAKLQQRSYPKDSEIADDIETLKSEKEKITQRIEKR
jgi:hypothetical protein